MSSLVHLIAGPPEHGVTEYARLLHEHTGGDAVAVTDSTRPDDLPPGPVHATFTDHLFGPTPDAAVDRLLGLCRGRRLSVSLHDIPQPAEGAERFARRARAYRRLAGAAAVVVTNSHHEAGFFEDGDDIQVIPLPLPTAPSDIERRVNPGSVGILGFIYPGKGHADIITALAGTGLKITALGGASTGHDSLVDHLAHTAHRHGVGFQASGYLPDAKLWQEMAEVAVPVCAHRHVSASGSLMRWIATGRRVLVTDSPYSREQARYWPDQVQVVDPAHWRESILAAAADPDFAAPVPEQTPWDWTDVAGRWTGIWARTLGPAFRDNDHAAVHRRQPTGISVIIPYYNDAERLRAVLAGVDRQDFTGEIEVIIADDGSAIPPAPTCRHPVTIVRQEDLGFRAAAARNLGAAAASHEVLAFLDGDTVPEPEYLSAAASWVAGDPRCVVAGSRLQHGQLPQWLADAYRDSRGLADADETSWRFLISAVLTCSAELFDRVGGFDGSMVGYGGEDWELAWRLWQAGAIFVHEPAARAHHDEPDWGNRAVDSASAAAEKNLETLALARRVTHPLARPAGVVFTTPDVRVELPRQASGWPVGVREACISSWLRLGDVQVIAPGSVPELFHADPRVVSTPAQAARIVVTLAAPAAAPADADALWVRVAALGGHVHLYADRQVAGSVTMTRHRRGAPLKLHIDTELFRGPVRLEQRFAGW